MARDDGPPKPPASSPANIYAYQTLDPSRQEIRLLTFRPRHSDHMETECNLQHVSLDDYPVYDCLSYTWGETKTDQQLPLDGTIVGVTENLKAALVQLQRRHNRNSDNNPAIWTDAVCIDQNNEAERNEQVQLMCQIYSRARQVLVWLGPESETTALAVKTMHEFSEELERRNLLPIQWPYPDSKSEHTQDLLEAKKGLASLGQPAMQALKDFFSRLWWRRVWVIQEVAVSQSAIMLSGEQVIPFTHVRNFVNFAEWACSAHKIDNDPQFLDVYRHIKVRAVAICRHTLHTDRAKPGLLQSIHNIYVKKEAQATDPKDRIFAILGLLDNDHVGIMVDYSKPCSAVYRDATRTLVQKSDLLILSYAAGIRENAAISVPSWVLDLTDAMVYPLGLDRRYRCLFSASGSVKQPTYQDMEDPDVLRVQVVWVGKISYVGRPAQKLSKWQIIDFENWIEDLKILTAKSDLTRPADEINDIVWRTAVADNLNDSTGLRRRTDPSDLDSYKALHQSIEDFRNGNEDTVFPKSLYVTEIQAVAPTRRGFRTANGLVGMGKETCRAGDDVFIILGHTTPFIFREQEPGVYSLLGEAYVHGAMDGSLMQEVPIVQTVLLR
ncbi:HET-domain-containing protein [Pyrenochaeta sp. DS3sAY3a]|nr:HET-domain-containing protein [Pyrenochaeta sp. DS3sAY3a]